MKFLITGGTGSFGTHYTEYLLGQGHEVTILSRNELKQWEMKKRFPDAKYLIGDVRDRTAIYAAAERQDYVIHAAALKHVATGETQPWEVIQTNVNGTKNVVDASNANGCRMVLLSTDKAVEPVNLYGASKMMAERIVIEGMQRVVRYGNIFGSSGSILHIFRKQAANGHRFTITDMRMTRFLLTFKEAMKIVDSATCASRGTYTIPALKAIRITDLALAFDENAQFDEIGIQPGEKLAEKLTPFFSSDDADKYSVAEIKELIDEHV